MPSPDTSEFSEILAQARQTAREQLGSAWLLHIAKTEEALRSDWEAHLQHLLTERFDALAPELETVIRSRVDTALQRETAVATRAITQRLNQASRRLLQAEKQEDWTLALLDAARPCAPRIGVLTVQGDRLRLERANPELPVCEFAAAEAAAFDQALRTGESLIAAWTPREISETLAGALGAPAEGSRVYAVPLEARGKPIGLLYADGPKDMVDMDALELLGSLAASVWDKRAPQPVAGLIDIEGAKPKSADFPAWEELSPEEQEKHLRAQRFARVQVAEWQLYKAESVQRGRIEAALYRVLQTEIDHARRQYQDQFLSNGGPMVDYMHLELVRKLANDKEDLLGPEYPGPLV
ncbi:MAG: hypothetical protein IT168_05775 [Bryobacterales bacterium]|nr:hypothetical protein [Bryobacterales bacterium]